MSILLAIVGATVGAVIGSLFMNWRNDEAKDRQQLESKTPYDYALTNAINERDRLQDELRTIQALKRTEADTERIRSEIDTILSDDGEGETESVYGGLNGIPIVQNSDGYISKAFAKAYGTDVREDDPKDGQFPDNGDEYADLGAIDKAIRDEQKVLCIYRNRNVEGFSGVEMAVGTLAKLRYRYGQTQYVILRVCSNNGGTHLLRISGEDLDEISLLGGESNGEIVYRKGEM